MIIGEEFNLTFKFSQDDVVAFAKISGDNNPIHLDDEFAKKTIFKKPIMHGFLSASVFSKVLGTLFPGQGTIYLEQTLKFHRPMFIETEYLSRFKVVGIEKSIAQITTEIFDPDNKLTISGVAKILNEKI